MIRNGICSSPRSPRSPDSPPIPIPSLTRPVPKSLPSHSQVTPAKRLRPTKRWSEPLRRVTLAASAPAFPPTMQVPRRPPQSLSLGSLGHARLHNFDGCTKTPRCRIRSLSRPPFRASTSRVHHVTSSNSLGRNSPVSGGTRNGRSSIYSRHSSFSMR